MTRRPARQITADVDQQSRFRQRSEVLRDRLLSHGAARLFLLLDDEAWGEMVISFKQSDMAELLGVTDRQVRSLIVELVKARYLNKRHLMTGNVYDFHRKKTSGSATSIRQETSARTGSFLPPVPYIQESQEAIAPLAEERTFGPVHPEGRCIFCNGAKELGNGPNRSKCGGCRGTGLARKMA